MYEVNKENAIEFKTQWHFLCNRKLRFHYIKKLRKDRTAADKKYDAYCDPPQAENLASEIHFINETSSMIDLTFLRNELDHTLGKPGYTR